MKVWVIVDFEGHHVLSVSNSYIKAVEEASKEDGFDDATAVCVELKMR